MVGTRIQPIQLTNRQFNALIPNRAQSIRIASIDSTGVVRSTWRMSFGGHREDHYDFTPTAPQDTPIFLAANNNQQNWMAIPVAVELPDGRWAAMGLNTRMHASFQGGGRPGAPFASHSNVRPANGWKPNGGHVCGYLINSTGGAGESENRHARADANRLANNGTRGRNSRAAAFEAWFRGGSSSTLPPIVPPPNIVTVNYQVRITTTTTPLSVRSEPSTVGGARTVIGTVNRGSTQNITGETTGSGATAWLRINFGGRDGFISSDFTERIIEQIPAGTWSMQALASRNAADANKAVARMLTAGHGNAYVANNNGWFQARVGPFLTRSEAMTIRDRLITLGYRDAFPVQN